MKKRVFESNNIKHTKSVCNNFFFLHYQAFLSFFPMFIAFSNSQWKVKGLISLSFSDNQVFRIYKANNVCALHKVTFTFFIQLISDVHFYMVKNKILFKLIFIYLVFFLSAKVNIILSIYRNYNLTFYFQFTTCIYLCPYTFC